MRNSRLHLLSVFIFLYIFFIISYIYAQKITNFKLIGNTLDLGIEKMLKKMLVEEKSDLDRKDIESIGTRVTNEYHQLGYTTTYVDRLVLKKDGVLEIYIRESRILKVNISGADSKDVRDIELMIVPVKSEVYNKFDIERRVERIKRIYDFHDAKIYAINYKDSGDVFLSVKLEKKVRGNFYGGIGVNPIYGFSPSLGYFYPFKDSALDLFSRAGYRDGEFRRLEGDAKYFFFTDETNIAYYFGVKSSRLLEVWETIDKEYTVLSITPITGVRYIHRYIMLDLRLNEIVASIDNYRDDKFINYDTRLALEIEVSNRFRLLVKDDSTDLKLSLSAGKSELNPEGYIISALYFKTSIMPFSWLRFIPQAHIYYTGSDERFLHSYVYDRHLIGFFDDFTASRWKNMGGVDTEIEVITQRFYAGPFINSGYFKDEFDNWKRETGGGVKGKISYRRLLVEIYFAWDLSEGPSSGGLFITGGSRF